MSTLKVNRIEPRTGDTVDIVGLDIPESPVKAWVNFNGTGVVAIRDSMNVSSITDLGVGHYKINFDNPMSNADYTAHASASPNKDDNSVSTNLGRIAVFANPNGTTNTSSPSYQAPTVNEFNVLYAINTMNQRVDPKAFCITVIA